MLALMALDRPTRSYHLIKNTLVTFTVSNAHRTLLMGGKDASFRFGIATLELAKLVIGTNLLSYKMIKLILAQMMLPCHP